MLSPEQIAVPLDLLQWDGWPALVVRAVKSSSSSESSERICREAASLLETQALLDRNLWDNLIRGIPISFGNMPSDFQPEASCPITSKPWETRVFEEEVGCSDEAWFKRPSVSADSDWREAIQDRIRECYDRAVRMYQIYVWIANLHGIRGEPNKARRNETLYMWFLYACSGRLEKVLKYKTAHLLAVCLKQVDLPTPIELYPSDRPDYLFGGAIGRSLRSRLVGGRGKTPNVRLAYDLYCAKRGSVPVDDRFIDDALVKHFDLVTTDQPEIVEGPEMETFLPEVRRSAYEAVGNYALHRAEFTVLYRDVSTQCDFPEEEMRAPCNGDAYLCWLLDFVNFWEDDVETGMSCQTETPFIHRGVREWKKSSRRRTKCPTFGSCVQNPRYKGGAFAKLTYHSSFPGRPTEGYLLRFVESRTFVYEVRVPEDPLEWEYREEEIHRMAIQDTSPIPCGPIGLQEPFKVRVITRGDCVRYHLCREWQPVLHRSLARLDPFHLTMGPCEPRHIEQLLAKANQFNHPEEGFWVSGDYESATDNLSPELSDAAMEAMCDALGVDYEDRQVLLHALCGHLVEFSGRDDGERAISPQQWGQLMGSPVSFPILCLVNAAITRCWMEREFGRKMTLTSAPMLINGDDILFWCPSMDAYGRWKEMVTAAGLKPSLGKNYTSDRFLVINSQIWEVMRRVDYFGQNSYVLKSSLPTVNLGLYYDVQKSQSSHGAEKTLFGSHIMQRDSFRELATDWINGYPEDRDGMLSLLLRKRKDFLDQLPTGMSWWCHPKLGGLGLPVTREVTITNRQRKLAGLLFLEQDPTKRWQMMPSLQSPLPAFVDVAMRDFSRVAKALHVTYSYEVGAKPDEGYWKLLSDYYMLGLDSTDPEGYAAFQRGFERLWSLSGKHWALPLAFRHCIEGPTGELRPSNKIRWA
jgi:hypothetical protein